MFGFGARLPVSEADSVWVDQAFVRLERLLGRDRMLQARAVMPTDEFFPDRYDGSHASVEAMCYRIATSMGVPESAFELEFFDSDFEQLREAVPFYTAAAGYKQGAGGLFFGKALEGKYTIALNEAKLRDPIAAAATLAHELAHVILLGSGLLDREDPEMEPLTDLCTAFLGLGVLSANACFRFTQFTDSRSQGWSTSRAGYLPERVWGYALARFAQERGEEKPAWAKHPESGVAAYFSQSAKWLRSQKR